MKIVGSSRIYSTNAGLPREGWTVARVITEGRSRSGIKVVDLSTWLASRYQFAEHYSRE
jgi:hypothetical protein